MRFECKRDSEDDEEEEEEEDDEDPVGMTVAPVVLDGEIRDGDELHSDELLRDPEIVVLPFTLTEAEVAAAANDRTSEFPWTIVAGCSCCCCCCE